MFDAVSCQVPNVPVATFFSTDSVDAPSQAYSQSWIVPAPLVARWVNQSRGHHSLEDRCGAVAQQVGAVDQDDGGAAAAGGADLLGAVVDQGVRGDRSRGVGRSPGR